MPFSFGSQSDFLILFQSHLICRAVYIALLQNVSKHIYILLLLELRKYFVLFFRYDESEHSPASESNLVCSLVCELNAVVESVLVCYFQIKLINAY